MSATGDANDRFYSAPAQMLSQKHDVPFFKAFFAGQFT
jgi:hypothetical protein